jgi:hypothetical protein
MRTLNQMQRSTTFNRGTLRLWVATVVAVVCSAFAPGCMSVHWISDYDKTSDDMLTALQQKVAKLDATIEDDNTTSYSTLKASYLDIEADIKVLIIRNTAFAKNGNMIIALNSLADAVKRMENVHKRNNKMPAILVSGANSMPASVERELTNILRLELALKGDVTGAGPTPPPAPNKANSSAGGSAVSKPTP